MLPPPIVGCQERRSHLRSVLTLWHPERVPTARERIRAEVTSEITDAARRQLAEVGAAALSLRAAKLTARGSTQIYTAAMQSAREQVQTILTELGFSGRHFSVIERASDLHRGPVIGKVGWEDGREAPSTTEP